MNSFGTIFRLTSFGESHGRAIGGVVDGVPSGFHLDLDKIQNGLERRAPGSSKFVSARREKDEVIFLSGITNEGITLGTPIGFVIPNTDTRPEHYENLRTAYRPNHADYTYQLRYGIRDYRGGGRASARETACRMVGGAIALQLLKARDIEIMAQLCSIGPIENHSENEITPEMELYVDQCRRNGDSTGGVVKIKVKGMPGGVGEPVYGKLQCSLAQAMMSINAVRGFQFGLGFKAAKSLGSEMLDIYTEASMIDGKLHLASSTNYNGGILGGITTGGDIEFEVAFKPTPSIPGPLPTFDNCGQATTVTIAGRHDPCVAIRGLHVVRAMTAMVLQDALMIHSATSLHQ